MLQIKDVSVAGLSFKDAMKFVSIQERPLCVRFATPLAEGDAPTDGGAPASAEEAKPEAKPEAAAIEQEKAKLIAKEAVLLDELKKLDEKETAPAAAAAAFNPFAPGAAAAAAPAAAAPANPFGSPPASRAPAALPNPFAPAAMAAARSSPKVATMETQRQIYHYDRNSFSVKPAGMATECRNLSVPLSFPSPLIVLDDDVSRLCTGWRRRWRARQRRAARRPPQPPPRAASARTSSQSRCALRWAATA